MLLYLHTYWGNHSFSKIRYFKITNFSKITVFQKYVIFKITVFSKTRYFKITVFAHIGEITVFAHFYRIPCFFQNFRVFKKFPVQSSLGIPYKNSVCFPKIPRSENYRCYKFRGFFSKNSVFYKIPRFSYFLNL